jgi:hypothetical protein
MRSESDVRPVELAVSEAVSLGLVSIGGLKDLRESSDYFREHGYRFE